MELIHLTLPTSADYARSVRMLAANLAVVAQFDVDAVEDIRMAAEEGFVYCCATKPENVNVDFEISDTAMQLSFGLGELDPQDLEGGPDIKLLELLLNSLCDELEDTGDSLVLTKYREVVGA